MPKLISSNFQQFEFTSEELLQACKLTNLQECRLKSLQGDIANQKLTELFDPEHPIKYAQTEAFLSGQLNLLNLLLESSIAAYSNNLEEDSNKLTRN
jgi:hypothetical protein